MLEWTTGMESLLECMVLVLARRNTGLTVIGVYLLRGEVITSSSFFTFTASKSHANQVASLLIELNVNLYFLLYEKPKRKCLEVGPALNSSFTIKPLQP